MKNIAKIYKRKILIVEDDELNRSILASILSPYFEILEASNGLEGFKIVNNKDIAISLILLDIQMPVMNGYEFLNEINKSNELKSIPIIVTTSDQSEEERCLTEGASDFVRKPYSPNIILRRVEALIRLTEASTLIKQNEFDQVTKLYTRVYFDYMVDRILLSDKKTEYAAMLFNIEDYQHLNATFGEDDMNATLKYIASGITKIKCDSLIASKYGIDRFALFFKTNDISIDKVIDLIDSFTNISAPIKNIKIKYAYYINPSRALSSSNIFNRIYDSLLLIQHDYLTKSIEFKESSLIKQNRKRFIENNMKQSLQNEEFKVYFQPKHDPYTNKLVGAEALVRWIHPKIGFLSPGDFVPVLESTGFITDLDFYIFEKTCFYLRKLLDSGFSIVPVSINLSRRDLAVMSSCNLICKTLEKYNIDKKYIHFEITESVAGINQDTISKSSMLKNNGFEIEIDDFGSGYSALGIISDIPMNYLKLDITFARNITKEKEVIRAVIAMAHALKVKTIAEGVENNEQLSIYKELGVDYIQGYYYSKPMPFDEYCNYIKKYN